MVFTDKEGTNTIKADFANGNVAMTGCSYGGTIPYEVATTGVEGLTTIIPFAGIANWYDYTNSQGVSTRFDTDYADWLAAYNAGAAFEDDDWLVPNDTYGSFLYQLAKDQEASNGNYSDVWSWLDYSDKYEDINCSALIVHGLNDFNVRTRQADLMMQAFTKAGKNAKLVLHQNGHDILDDMEINGELWQDTMNKWLARYLYGVDNGIDAMPAVTVQSNVDGSFTTYDTWRDFEYKEFGVTSHSDYAVSTIDTTSLAETAYEHMSSDSSDTFYFVIAEHPWGQESSMREPPFEGEEHCFTLHMAFFFRDH
ncbi:MAG: prolyl oligopeptidase family serine peptidase, partial [Oscillospiraceae bacterium]|nr:prolyl oligopeptidase family serine peptidase [Oscillospiraceae bacterium]